jgi:hypothetical protein
MVFQDCHEQNYLKNSAQPQAGHGKCKYPLARLVTLFCPLSPVPVPDYKSSDSVLQVFWAWFTRMAVKLAPPERTIVLRFWGLNCGKESV